MASTDYNGSMLLVACTINSASATHSQQAPDNNASVIMKLCDLTPSGTVFNHAVQRRPYGNHTIWYIYVCSKADKGQLSLAHGTETKTDYIAQKKRCRQKFVKAVREEEVELRINVHKSPGPDGLPNWLLKDIASLFENGRISNFQRLMTLTLVRVILHTVVHHSSTSTYIPNFIKIEETFWTNGRTYGWTFETHFFRSTQKSWPKNYK